MISAIPIEVLPKSSQANGALNVELIQIYKGNQDAPMPMASRIFLIKEKTFFFCLPHPLLMNLHLNLPENHTLTVVSQP
ncbi:hypothetical protein BRADI_4g15005v3 [Brachypodium distachyon]|uniref:Uncharacterized protein n=1 Tax=Brachypodium distachyon TaxID=15368 RepID=A0A2K2CMY0_BRADI|nr:hypothetical protein BRADI_4g15005v3 [Brachypodium distachyon]